MSTSSARLEAVRVGSETRIARSFASSPQRWTAACQGSGGWSEVTHQLLGDGSFGGEGHRTLIRAGAHSRLLVRGVAPTALRGPTASLAAARLAVGTGASLMYFPGAIVPHTGSRHSNSVTASLEEGATALVGSIVLPGRTAMGESGAFELLRLKTVVRLAGGLCLAEDATVAGGWLDGVGMFARAHAYVSLLALGCTPAADPEWWEGLSPEGLGVSRLRFGGVAVRALCPTLGAALALTAEAEARWRAAEAVRQQPGFLASEQSPAG